MNKQKHTTDARPWYKERWSWIVMSGPAIVVVAGFYTFYLAVNTEDTLVTDDYYKEGKNIILEVERDQYADKHHISAQAFIQNDMSGVMVLTKGQYDENSPLTLKFFHPTIGKYDMDVPLVQSANNPFQYTAKLPESLPKTNSWIMRLQDDKDTWRIEARWIVSQGNSINLTPIHTGALSEHR